MRGAPENERLVPSGETEKGVATMLTPKYQTEVGRAYVEKMTRRGDNLNALGEPTPELSHPSEEALHEKGKGCVGGEKKLKKLAPSSESALDSSTNHGNKLEDMYWEKVPIPMKEPNLNFLLAPNEVQSNNVEGPINKEVEMGPMALSYDLNEGWVASKLGPSSGHWKRLAREVKQTKSNGKKKRGNEV